MKPRNIAICATVKERDLVQQLSIELADINFTFFQDEIVDLLNNNTLEIENFGLIVFIFTDENSNSKAHIDSYETVLKLIWDSRRIVKSYYVGNIGTPYFIRGNDLSLIRAFGLSRIQIAQSIANGLRSQFDDLEDIDFSYNRNYLELFRSIKHDIDNNRDVPYRDELKGRIRRHLIRLESNPELLEDKETRELYEFMLQFTGQKLQQTAHYILKVNPNVWKMEELKAGYSARFHTHDLQNNQRLDYRIFKKLKIGDLLIGFAFHNYMSAVCVFRLVQPVRNDERYGENIELEVVSEISPTVELDTFRLKIDFADKLGNISPERLFEINTEVFEFITGEAKVHELISSTFDKEPNYDNDFNFKTTEDQLDFGNDVDSFATVIALRSLKPPLAIGLFGEWGSGKSFFMEKLAERIDVLTQRPGDRFLKNIVHVKFNAWHYSDSNLWASLITHIFEELNRYASDTKFDQKTVKNLYDKLELTTIAIVDQKSAIDELDLKLQKLDNDRLVLEDIIKTKKEQWSMLSTRDILEVALKEPVVRAGLEKIKQVNGVNQVLDSVNEIDTRLSELNSWGKRIAEVWTFLSGKGNGWKVLVGFVLFMAFLSLLFFPPFQNVTIKYLTKMGSFLMSVIIFLRGFEWIRPHIRTTNKYYNRLKRLRNHIQQRADQIQYIEKEDINRLDVEIGQMENKKSHLLEQLNEKESDKARLNQELGEIGSGKKITSFISGKAGEFGYQNELGIISRVRRDFFALDELFREQKLINTKDHIGKEPFYIDRIVLYIDDLDRCQAEIVLKTLEAIHLLLALELFVVVVGVDSKWLNNAVASKYEKMFKQNFETGTDNISHLPKKVITSHDFLEKIFQIPFALKSIQDSGKRKLIDYLTREDLLIEVSGQEASDQELLVEKSVSGQPSKEFNTNPKNETISIQEDLVINVEERVTLSADEVSSIQELAFIFGHTPRTIKRFINIYRIIKAHKNYLVKASPSRSDYLPTLISLSIIVGCPQVAKDYQNAVNQSDLVPLKDFIKQLERNTLGRLLSELPDDLISSINTQMLRTNLELIIRFSFIT